MPFHKKKSVFVDSPFVKTSDEQLKWINYTGYSFWDRMRNFSHKFTQIVLSVHKLKKLGKFW